jgi:hypothetical protein
MNLILVSVMIQGVDRGGLLCAVSRIKDQSDPSAAYPLSRFVWDRGLLLGPSHCGKGLGRGSPVPKFLPAPQIPTSIDGPSLDVRPWEHTGENSSSVKSQFTGNGVKGEPQQFKS